MDDTAPQITVRSRGEERCEARIRHHVIRVDQPPDAFEHDLGPTPVELFVAGIAADITQYACRYLHRFGLPAAVTVTARYRRQIQPARLGGIDLEVSVTDLPLGLRASFLNALEHCPAYETLRIQPELSITLRSTAHDPAAGQP